MAIVRHNARLWLQQQNEHHHTHLTSVQGLASSQQDTYKGSSLTQDQRARMDDHKEMAIARRNARLRQQQQDGHQTMYHKPPNSKQGKSLVCMESQKSATSLLTKCRQENDVSLSQQESDISLSPHQRISSQQDASSSRTVQSDCSLQVKSEGGFSFTPVESSLSSQEDSYGASFLALKQNGHSASSRETVSLCSQSALANSQHDCASILSMDLVAKGFQPLAPNQLGASTLSEQQHRGNMGSISLTLEQKARIASQKERALARRKMILEQRQLQQHHVNQPSERLEGCSQAPSPCSPVPRANSHVARNQVLRHDLPQMDVPRSWVAPPQPLRAEAQTYRDHFLQLTKDGFTQRPGYMDTDCMSHAMRSTTGQLGASSHILDGRAARPAGSKVSRQARMCRLCQREVESEEHYVCRCPAYSEIRGRYPSLFREGFGPLNRVMSYPDQRCLGLFLSEIRRHREGILQEQRVRAEAAQTRITSFFQPTTGNVISNVYEF